MSAPLPPWLEFPDPEVFFSGAFTEDRVTLDFETDVQENYGHAVEPANGMVMGVYRWRSQEYVVWGDEFSTRWQHLRDVFAKLNQKWGFIPLVAHNASYELAWIHRMGLADLYDILAFDTKIGEYVLMGNLAARNRKTGRPGRSTSLDDCCRRRGWSPKDPIIDMWMKHGVNVREMPPKWVEDRCALDVESTDKLFLDQRSRLAWLNLLPVAFTRNIFTPFLTAITMNGLAVDPERVLPQWEQAKADLAEADAEMRAISDGMNWKSPPQVREYLYEKLKFVPQMKKGRKVEPRLTPGGELPTDEEAMEHCMKTAKTAEQKRFVELRMKLQGLKYTKQTLDFFAAVCLEKDGIFHGEFNQTKTGTHRLASQGRPFVSTTVLDEKGKGKVLSAQLQNLANSQKGLFCARRPGWQVIEADGAQIEFRVGGFLGNDDQIRADIENPDFDAHCTSAASMFQVPYEELLSGKRAGDEEAIKMRKAAKAHTFKPFYGGEQGSESEERWYREFKVRYAGLAAAQERWAQEVARDGELRTPWGLRYYWPDAKLYKQSGRLNVRQQVANYPVQGLATGEIVPIACVYLWHRCRGEDRVLFVNTVHDSVISEIEPSYEAEYTSLAKAAFTTDVYRYLALVYGLDFDLPLGVGVSMASHWGEGPENAWDIYPDGRERAT